MKTKARIADEKPEYAGSVRYPATRWSLVQAAGDGDQEALNTLFEAYWFPVYGAFFDKVKNHHDAEDLTQKLFSDFYRREDLAAMAPENGRFRSFLKVAADHLHCNFVDEKTALKRGGDKPTFSVDADKAKEWLLQESAHLSDPSEIFDRRLLYSILETAKTNLRHILTEQGKAEVYDALEDALLPQAREHPFEVIAQRLNQTPGAARVTAYRVREQYRQQIRMGFLRIVESIEEAEE
ncbi:MAG: hypothetical protein MI807_11215, partial [Verrucomicrobiales bacterium]|nr:hypothetical protein [Verrucomicrobiales bacterium]